MSSPRATKSSCARAGRSAGRGASALVAAAALGLALARLALGGSPAEPARSNARTPLVAQRGQQTVAQPRDVVEVRPFSIPDTRAAAALAERVKQHVAAGRWSECLNDLQELIEKHRDELLGEERPQRSQQPVHAGVGPWARDTLLALPENARRMYRERFEPRAKAALERARAESDLSALGAIPRRWPTTPSAERAWWTIGDLELERGHRIEARLAWSRALAARLGRASLALGPGGDGWEVLDADARQNGTLSEGIARRLALVREGSEASATLAPPRRDELRLPGPGEGAQGAPSEDASTWAQPYALRPHPWLMTPLAMYPVRSGDAVLVSNSMGLACINAYSGTERWYSGEAPGWNRLEGRERSDFFKGLDFVGALVAPAASDAIAVAALQIPVSQHENADFNSIPILRIIPDRRLFAFDIQSGRELWNHMPPPGWDGEAGSFAERMRVAGPPVVQSGRIVVPVYRMQGRIDCHLACYALATGELIWSTPVVSGQRELNMFNRPEVEYSAPPVRIEGDRVVVLTQLGTIAAVDLFSGALLWETLYDQIPQPARTNANPPRRDPSWRNSAPVVADGVVIAAPIDSEDLVGIDLESGALLWSLRQRRASDIAGGRSGSDVDLLLGADEHRVYLAGRRVAAIEAPGGLRFGPPTQLVWQRDDDFLRQDDSYARPVLTADRVVVPTRTARIEIDRYQGRLVSHMIPWKQGHGGNLLIGDGMLFTLDSRALCGYFEWSFLLERARAAHDAEPTASGPALDLASLLAERGRTEWEAGHSDRARDWLDEAVSVLSPFVAEDPRDAEPEVATRLFAVLRSKARVLADLADAGGALDSLRSARALAPTREARRDCLLEESELLRGRDDAERLRTFEELEYQAGDLTLRCENVPTDAGSSAAADASAVRTPPAVYLGPGAAGRRLAPLYGRPPRSELGVWELPVGLWVALERADVAALQRDPARELGELHRILELWPDEPLPGGSAGRIASQRIARARELSPTAYAPFERKAKALLDAALASDDGGELERVVERFPHSEASRRANDLLLDRAAASGAVADAARIALGELSDPWSASRASARELSLLLRLGAALRAEGNASFARELVRELAKVQPNAISPLASDSGLALRELAAREVEPPAPQFAPRTFTGACVAVASFEGRHELLVSIPPDEGARGVASEVLLFAREENPERTPSSRRVTLVAFDGERPDRPAWSEELPEAQSPGYWTDRAAFAPGLAFVATKRDVIAYARDGGADARPRKWTFTPFEGEVKAVASSSGVVLAIVEAPRGGSYRMHALDAASGLELWRVDVPTGEYGHAPICGSGKAVILPSNLQQRALVYDLFTGRRTLEIELSLLRAEEARGAWIEDGRMIVPWFWQSRYPDRNQVLALDLETGELAWRIALSEVEGGEFLLHSVLRSQGQTLLVLQRQSGYGAGDGPAGELVDLRTPYGAFAPIRELAADQQLVGIESKGRVELDAPLVFLESFANGDRELRLFAVQLPYGNERWAQRIAVPREALTDPLLPLPAIGQSTVALVFTTTDGRGHRSELYCFDRATGAADGSQVLEKALGKSSDVSLHPLGDALLVRGQDLLQVMR